MWRTFHANDVVFLGNGREISARAATEFANLQPAVSGPLDETIYQRPNNVPTRAKPPMRPLDLLHFVVKSGIHVTRLFD
jgi:hypothetical protein